MFKATQKFIRPRILVTCYAFVFLGSAITGSITLKTILAIFVLVASYIHAASSNDYSDRYIDAVNLSDATDRPLVTKDASFKQVWLIHIFSGISALIFSFFYGPGATVLTIGMLMFDYAYSIKPVRISDRGIISQLLLAVAYVYYPLSLGYWSVSMHSGYPWLLSIGLYLGFVARLLLKDFRDIKGDKLHGKMTFLLRHGHKVTCAYSGLVGFVALLVIAFAIQFSPGTLLVLVFGQILADIYLLQLAKTKDINAQVRLVAVIAKVANAAVITLLAFFLVKSQPNLSHAQIQLLPIIIGFTVYIAAWLNYTETSKVMPSILQHLAWAPLRLFLVVFCSVTIEGLENIKGINQAIIASNHSSEFDPFLIVACLPFLSPWLPLFYVSRGKSFYKKGWKTILYGGAVFKIMGGYPAYPGLNDYEKALRHHLTAIENGRSICIYPVGKKHFRSDLVKARAGVSFLAHKTRLPVVPVFMGGIEQLSFLDYLRGKGKLKVTFGKPLYSQDLFRTNGNVLGDLKRNDYEKASAEIMKKIAQLA